MMNYLKMETN